MADNTIFPFLGYTEKTDVTTELPLFKELAFDFETDSIILSDGKPLEVEGDKALEIWIYKALLTERFKYTGYNHDYGSELITLVGYSMSPDIAELEIDRFIRECLGVNPYIIDIQNMVVVASGSLAIATFDVLTVYNTSFPITQQINIEGGGAVGGNS